MINLPGKWSEWTIEELIGQGAYGKVYRIRKENMGNVSYAALKIIEIPESEAEVKTLLNAGMDHLSIKSYFEQTARGITDEIAMLESLKSAANIVIIEDYDLEEKKDSIGWKILIRMELLETLSDRQQKYGFLNKDEAVKLGIDIASALECCEEMKIIHRDVKPENVFVNRFRTYKLGDFGIAKRLENTTSAYSQKGTGLYMAPEVNRGDKYNQTVDIYSLGVMLYQLLNNQRLPFLPSDKKMLTPADFQEAVERRLSGEALPMPSGADEALGGIILKACDPVPANRYQSASELKKALQEWQEGIVKPIPVPTPIVPVIDSQIDNPPKPEEPIEPEPPIPEPEKTVTNEKKRGPLVLIIGGVILACIIIFAIIKSGNRAATKTADESSAQNQLERESTVQVTETKNESAQETGTKNESAQETETKNESAQETDMSLTEESEEDSMDKTLTEDMMKEYISGCWYCIIKNDEGETLHLNLSLPEDLKCIKEFYSYVKWSKIKVENENTAIYDILSCTFNTNEANDGYSIDIVYDYEGKERNITLTKPLESSSNAIYITQEDIGLNNKEFIRNNDPGSDFADRTDAIKLSADETWDSVFRNLPSSITYKGKAFYTVTENDIKTMLESQGIKYYTEQNVKVESGLDAFGRQWNLTDDGSGFDLFDSEYISESNVMFWSSDNEMDGFTINVSDPGSEESLNYYNLFLPDGVPFKFGDSQESILQALGATKETTEALPDQWNYTASTNEILCMADRKEIYISIFNAGRFESISLCFSNGVLSYINVYTD